MKVSHHMQFDFAKCTIMVIGDVMLDVYFMGEVKRLSPEAPVPIVRISEKTSSIGGAGNVALNLASLGCNTILMGLRGNDQAGKRLASILKQKGIRDHILVDPNHPTTTKTRVIGQGQQLLRLDEEKVCISSQDLQQQLIERFEANLSISDAVVISDYAKGVLAGDSIPKIIKRCREKDIPVFVDPKGTDWVRYKGATCITPNTAEAESVAGQTIANDKSILIRIAQALRKQYELDWLLLTRGAEGMFLLGPDNNPQLIQTSAKEVFDVSGAGDTVIACLTACVASGLTFRQAASIANVGAGIVVAKLGSQAISVPELQAALYKHKAGFGLESSYKITTLDAARIQVKAWQAIGETVVFTNGCFDLLHPGHIHVLNQAKGMGNRLVLGVNTDSSIRTIKGPDRPIVSEQDRAAVLSALGCVDLIVFFSEATPLALIAALRPDILVKGADYRLDEVVGGDIVESYGGKIALIPLLKGYSTTGLVNKFNHKD